MMQRGKDNGSSFAAVFFSLVIALLLSTSLLKATDLPQVLHYKRGFAGLNAQTIYRITTDPFGYLWLATNEGIYVFNGNTFRPFATPAGDLEFVSAARIDEFWYCFTYAGEIVEINLISRSVKLIPYAGPNAQSVQPKINAFKIDSQLIISDNGLVLFEVTRDTTGNTTGYCELGNPAPTIAQLFAGAEVLDTEFKDLGIPQLYKWTQSLHRITNQEVILKNALYVLIESGEKGSKKNLVQKLDFSTLVQHPFLVDYAFHKDYLLAGFFNGGGVYIYEAESKTTSLKSGIHLLKDNSVTDIEKGTEDHIWVATQNNGLYLLNFSITKNEALNASIPNPENVTHTKFIGNRLFIGNKDGQVLSISQGREKKFQLTTPNIFNEIYGIFQVKDTLLLFVSKDAIALSDGNRIIWEEKAKSKRFVKDCTEDEHRIYLAQRRQITVIEKKTLKTHILQHDSLAFATTVSATTKGKIITGGPQGLFVDNVAIMPEKSVRVYNLRSWGNYTVACTNKGVIYLTSDGTINEQLSSFEDIGRLVKMAFVDNRQNLYLLSNKGLYFSRTPGVYTPVIQYHECNPIHTIYDMAFKGDESFVMTNAGLFKINELPTASEKKFARIVLNDKYETSPQKSDFTERFSKFSGYVFRYEQVDFEMQDDKILWELYRGNQIKPLLIDTADLTTPFVPFKLNPGQYTITARHLSQKNKLNSTVYFSLWITPRLWQRMPIQILAIALLSILLILIIQQIINIKVRAEQIKVKREQELTLHRQALQISRMRPHFLFNSFNPIQALILQKRPMEALEYISQLTKLLRTSMNQFEKEFVCVGEEVSFLKNYLYIEERRNEGAYELSINISPDIIEKETFVPSMILQPLLENSIMHGRKEGEAVRITINFDIDGSQLCIEVFDNGPGFPENFEIKESHALEIISKRITLIKKLFGTGSFEILSNREGAHILIMLPLLNEVP